ncbi:tegument antigen [Clonorchis sinensis]|uniref:Tegument antigen n=1 Tax=Clonorchis sinensis TaxID=79923 RepID=G7YV08_CLOSI|nr:tegument antigen [Clonorchis sinensis]
MHRSKEYGITVPKSYSLFRNVILTTPPKTTIFCPRFHKFAQRLRASSTTTLNVRVSNVFGVWILFVIEIRYVYQIPAQLAVDQCRDLSSNDIGFQPTQLIRMSCTFTLYTPFCLLVFRTCFNMRVRQFRSQSLITPRAGPDVDSVTKWLDGTLPMKIVENSWFSFVVRNVCRCGGNVTERKPLAWKIASLKRITHPHYYANIPTGCCLANRRTVVTVNSKYKCLLANPVAWRSCVCSSFVYPQEYAAAMVSVFTEVNHASSSSKTATSVLTLMLYCRITIRKVEQSFERALFTTPLDSGNIPPAKVIHSQMEEFMQNRVVRMSQKLIPLEDSAPTEVLADASKKLKSSLEHAYGSTWQVAIIEGSYWMTHTHSVRRTFHFRHGSKTIVVWQTPIRRRSDRTTS